MEYILSTLLTAAVFVILILLLAAKPKISTMLTCLAFGFGGICGLFIYGYGYAVVLDNFLLAILKAVLAVCGSFVGKNTVLLLLRPLCRPNGCRLFAPLPKSVLYMLLPVPLFPLSVPRR